MSRVIAIDSLTKRINYWTILITQNNFAFLTITRINSNFAFYIVKRCLKYIVWRLYATRARARFFTRVQYITWSLHKSTSIFFGQLPNTKLDNAITDASQQTDLIGNIQNAITERGMNREAQKYPEWRQATRTRNSCRFGPDCSHDDVHVRVTRVSHFAWWPFFPKLVINKCGIIHIQKKKSTVSSKNFCSNSVYCYYASFNKTSIYLMHEFFDKLKKNTYKLIKLWLNVADEARNIPISIVRANVVFTRHENFFSWKSLLHRACRQFHDPDLACGRNRLSDSFLFSFPFFAFSFFPLSLFFLLSKSAPSLRLFYGAASS